MPGILPTHPRGSTGATGHTELAGETEARYIVRAGEAAFSTQGPGKSADGQCGRRADRGVVACHTVVRIVQFRGREAQNVNRI